MPAVVSRSLLAFAMSMDDVVISIFINGPKLATLPIKVYTQIKTGVTPEVNALCTIMLAFTVIVLLLYSLIRSIRRKKTGKKFFQQEFLLWNQVFTFTEEKRV